MSQTTHPVHCTKHHYILNTMDVSQTTHPHYYIEHYHKEHHPVMVDVSQSTFPIHYLGHFNTTLYQISHSHQAIVDVFQTTHPKPCPGLIIISKISQLLVH